MLDDQEKTTDADSEPVNVEKLKKYIMLHANVRARNNSEYKHYYIPFRRCTVEDFEENGLKIKESDRLQYTERLCPDFRDN